jgi:hypothetical protein
MSATIMRISELILIGWALQIPHAIIAMAQEPPQCGLSFYNLIEYCDPTGAKLVEDGWRVQVYFGYPGEGAAAFQAIPGSGIPKMGGTYFFNRRPLMFPPPRHPFIQLQLRVWNTNSAPTWEGAVALAECDSAHWVGVSRIIEQNPWSTDCECQIGICIFNSLQQFGRRVNVASLPQVLRLRSDYQADGLHLRICNRGESEARLEQSDDLVNWVGVEDAVEIGPEEYHIPTLRLTARSYFRVRRISPEVLL